MRTSSHSNSHLKHKPRGYQLSMRFKVLSEQDGYRGRSFIGTGAASTCKYTERLAEAGLEPSVGSVGDGCDNALAETINGLFKAKAIHRRGPLSSFKAVEYATLEWVDWSTDRRLLQPIGNIPPDEA